MERAIKILNRELQNRESMLMQKEHFLRVNEIKVEIKSLNKVLDLVNNLPIGSVMPRSLTAENGGKALLNGEFHETFEDTDEEGNEYSIKIPVRWTTIKDIYKKIIDHYGA